MIKLTDLITEEIDEYDVENEEDLRSFIDFIRKYKEILAAL